MGLNSRLASMAKKMIIRDGTPAIYRKTLDGTYDPETGEVVSTVVDYNVNVVLFDYTRAANGQKATDGTLIETTDKEVYMISSDVFVLQAGVDKVVIGDKEYIIKNIKRHSTDNTTTVMYTLTLEW